MKIFSTSLVLCTLFVARSLALPSRSQSELGWNQLLQADDLFDTPSNVIQSKSFDTAVVVDELNNLLGNDDFLGQIYSKFCTTYGKQMDSNRMATFKSNLLMFATKNAEAMANGQDLTLGVTQFADLTFEEFSSKYLTKVSDYPVQQNVTFATLPEGEAPGNGGVDWRSQNKLTPIKQQGECNTCAIFSVTAAVEAGLSILYGNPPYDLSEQQIVDCGAFVSWDICQGKGGTWAKDSVQYINDNGLASLNDYPYIGTKWGKQQCNWGVNKKKISVNYAFVQQGDVAGLERAVAKAPVVIGVFVNQDFMNYKGQGVFQPYDCQAGQQFRHAILVVGYTDDRWIIRNSWDTYWGDQGYIYLAKQNNCWSENPTIVNVTQ